MIRIRWSWRRLGIMTVLLGLGWIGFDRLKAWNNVGQLRLAQREIARGQFEPAYRRLAVLSAQPGALEGAADYWLGVCEALNNRPDAALRAFARLPQDYAFDSLGAYLAAKAHMTRGELHAAERRLEQALPRGGSDLGRIRDLLNHIYQIEVRFDDAKALVRASLADAKDPIPILKELSNFELDRLPYEGLRATLEKAGRLAPEDDRVWLGKARLAIEAGRWNEAREWLSAVGPRAPMGRYGGRGSRYHVPPVDRKRRSMRCGSSAPRHLRLESGSLCGPGLFDNGAIRKRSRAPSNSRSRLNPRQRRSWNASPSWRFRPDSGSALPTCDDARPSSSEP